MSSPFNPSSPIPTQTWTALPTVNGNFSSVSSNPSQAWGIVPTVNGNFVTVNILGVSYDEVGYGEGGYGQGGYDTPSVTSQSAATIWTVETLK